MVARWLSLGLGPAPDAFAAKLVSQSQEIIIISAGGIVTRTPVKEKDPKKGITIQGRSTQGVKLMKLSDGDKVVAITCFD